MDKIYRIKIGDENFWIGAGLQLFRNRDMAIPVSFDEHIAVMEKISVEATAYSEDFDPSVHTFADILMKMCRRA